MSSLDTPIGTTTRALTKRTISSKRTHKSIGITMQFTTLATMLFAALAVASPIAQPEAEAVANVEVSSVTERSTSSSLEMADEAPECHP